MDVIFPNTVWVNSSTTEAVRIIYIAHYITQGFYSQMNFNVLPYPVLGNKSTIYFPDYKYYKIKNFWKIVKDNPVDIEQNNNLFVKNVEKLIKYGPANFSKLQSEWTNIQKDFWIDLRNFLPKYFDEIKKLEIRMTKYGSCGSGYSGLDPNKDKVILYIREDSDISTIFNALLIDRYYFMDSYKEYTWHESEAVMDFLINETYLKKYFTKSKPILKDLRDLKSAKYKKESEKYLASYGFSRSNIFEVDVNKILINGTRIELRNQENLVMISFVKNKGKIVTYDEIAEIIWGK